MSLPNASLRVLSLVLVILSCSFALSATSGNVEAGSAGQFWRVHWYQPGIEHGNPSYQGRFRVNSPEAVLHPEFGSRAEARENGLMLIKAEEQLKHITAAELYLELWGGHPGTAGKRVTVNGRSTYYLPRDGTEEMHCTYSYPVLKLRISDLVNGYNAFQFAVDQGSTFWGHMIIDNACLRVALTNGHPNLASTRLEGFASSVKVIESPPGAEEFHLRLNCSHPDAVQAVEFEGFYLGYDENGNFGERDWHGFTKEGKRVAHLGTATGAPFGIRWGTEMLPAQKDARVRAQISFKGLPGLVYVTPELPGLEIPHRERAEVIMLRSHDLPEPFWSRANNMKRCSIYVDADPARIERAELHINTWTGGAGGVKDYFTLNGRPLAVAEGTRHELVYSRIELPPGALKRGVNRFELLSDTDRHGIEVMLPGPCLILRLER